MERLTNEEHRILSVAAVSGATFDSLIVAEAAERDPAEVEDLLDRISRVHRLVSPLDEMQFPDHGLTTRHKFVHVLYQHYLYDDLPPAQRAQLHVRIADRLETHHGTEPQRVAAQLAFHFEMGRLLDKAASYYLVAARGEMAKLAIPQAEAFCKKSMQLIERLPDEHQRRQRLDALDVRAQVSSAMGRFEEAVAHYQEMARSAEAMEDPAAEIGALSQLLFPLVYIKQNERIRQTAGRVLKLGRTGSFPAAVARGHLALGMLYGLEGDFERASDHLEQSRVEAEHLGDAALLCMPLSEQAGLFCWQGRYREAVETMARARELALQAGDSQYVISSYFFDGMSHANLGNLSDALVSLEEGLRISSANNEQFWRVRFPNTLGWLHQEAFDFSRAAELNRESIESCVSLEMWEPAANSYVNLGTVALALGDPEGAKHALEEAEAIVSRDDWLRWRYQQRLQLGWAEYYLDRGDCAKAHEYAERCVSVASQSSGGKHLVLAYRQLGSIALALESFDEAESWLGTASAELERTDALLAAWRLHVTWAELGRKTGTKARARSHEQKAAEILQLMASQAPDDLRRSILQSETLIRLTSG
jgi:tetratricopeptide (TPR) repeat protein